MKKLIPLLVIISLLLTACGAQETDSLEARVREQFGDAVKKAVDTIERVRRDELSHVTRPFDAADAFRGEMEVSEQELEYLDAVGDYIVENTPEGLSAYDQYKYLGFVLSFCAEYDHDVH